MPSSTKFAKILGIQIEIHFSLFLVVAFLSWSLATGFLPDEYPTWDVTTYWVTGLVCALSLFVSVLLHEIAHSLMARRLGYSVQGITLFFLGGVSNLGSVTRRASDEFLVSVVGPLTSIAIAAVVGAVVLATDGSSPVFATLEYTALINLLLGLFNLLPAFPLDGGHVLRAAIWAGTGAFDRATSISTRIGQVAGVLLMGFGVFQVLQGFPLQGIWAAIVGWFLHNAASGSRRENELDRVLGRVTVGDVMEVSPPKIDPAVTIYDAVFDHLVHHAARALFVCEGDRLIGIVSVTDIKDVPRGAWRERLVRDEMTPVPLKTLTPSDRLNERPPKQCLIPAWREPRTPSPSNGRRPGCRGVDPRARHPVLSSNPGTWRVN